MRSGREEPRGATSTRSPIRVAFIGSAGIPNRYGGFESFLEQCGPALASQLTQVTVTCYSSLYDDRGFYGGVRRVFIRIPANGFLSTVHDLVAFLSVFRTSDQIVVLGISGGPWFPFFRLACFVGGKRLIVNTDGLEWRRRKFSAWRRLLLGGFDALAQVSAHRIVYDNAALLDFVLPTCRNKARHIGYAGDHVLRLTEAEPERGTALTVCRIEPENNLQMLIEGFLESPMSTYTIVGNWSHSSYGRDLRLRWARETRLKLLDPVYGPRELATLRERCDFYLHGHSVGGTNPSLVEMLFYDCRIACFDCAFNRETAGGTAHYFSNPRELEGILRNGARPDQVERARQRKRYTGQAIAAAYRDLLEEPDWRE